MRMLRRLAAPHVLLAAYCAGLVLSLAWRPAASVAALAVGALGAAALLDVTARRRHWRCAGTADGCAQTASEPPPDRSGEGLGGAGGEPNRRRLVLVVVLSLALAAVGLWVGGARLHALEQSSLVADIGRTVTLTGVLTDLPDIREDQVTLALAVTRCDGVAVDEPVHVRLRLGDGRRLELDPVGPLTEGAVVAISRVRVKPLPSPTPDAFDYGRYLRRRGEHVLLDAEFAALQVLGHRGGVGGVMDGLRRASRAHLAAGLHPPVRDVLQGMVLGDDEGVDQSLIDDFRASGLLHIMAVSGENVVLLCTMWSFAFMMLAVPRLLRTALLTPVVATYVVLTGASPSIVRAGVAGVIGLLAVLASRPSDGWLLWLAPAAWLLSANPHNLFDVSFLLSFGAVAGLLLLARPLTRMLGFLPGPLPEQIGVTMAASLSTAPISMLTFGSTSLVSVPANVAGGFVLGPIMFLGMLSLLLGFVSSWISMPLNVVAGLFIGFLLTVARLFGRLPGAVYEWQGMSLGLTLIAVLAIVFVALWYLARRARVSMLAYVRAEGRGAFVAAAVAVALAGALLLAPVGPAAPAQTTLTFLDVGEGAATLLQVPSGPTVLIDAGPAPLARTLREHGVRRIDLLVLSHGHVDHAAGLSDVIGRMTIGTALLPQPPQPSASLDRLASELAASGTDVRRCDAALAQTGDGWSVQILPTHGEGGDANQDENDCALVVVAQIGGRRALLPGDAEGPALADLGLPPCDVVGVPHHGSRGGLNAALLAGLAPRVAVVPVGPNTYGHPTDETMALLSAAGVGVLRTDERGDVAVTVVDDGLSVRVERR